MCQVHECPFSISVQPPHFSFKNSLAGLKKNLPGIASKPGQQRTTTEKCGEHTRVWNELGCAVPCNCNSRCLKTWHKAIIKYKISVSDALHTVGNTGKHLNSHASHTRPDLADNPDFSRAQKVYRHRTARQQDSKYKAAQLPWIYNADGRPQAELIFQFTAPGISSSFSASV